MTRFDNSRSHRSIPAALGAAAVGISFTAAGCSPKKKPAANGEEPKLNFYTWDTYIGKTTLADFEKASGIVDHRVPGMYSALAETDFYNASLQFTPN